MFGILFSRLCLNWWRHCQTSGNEYFRGEVFDENFLMSVATIGAFFIGEYPEAVAVMLFYQVGEWFQSAAVDQSRKSIAKLMDIRPDSANLLVNGQIKAVAPDTIEIGQQILVKPVKKFH